MDENVKDTNSDVTPKNKGEMSAVAKWLRLLRRNLHFRFPNFISDPEMPLSEFRKRDREENQKTEIPRTEDLRVTVIWGMELYTQNHLSDLNNSLRKLNWLSQSQLTENRNLKKWLDYHRIYGAGDSFFNLGYVRNTEGNSSRHADYTAPIPLGVDHLIVQIHQITASLTGISVGFVLDESLSACYVDELNTPRESIYRRSSGQRGYSILNASDLKTEACISARNHLTSIADKWFQDNIPGFFCNSARKKKVPSVELVTNISEKLIFPNHESSEPAMWRNILGLGTTFDVWESSEIGKIRMTSDTNRHSRMEANFHAVCSIQENDVGNKEVAIYGPISVKESIINKCSMGLSGFLCWFSVIAYLYEIRGSLRELRTTLTKPGKSYRDLMKALKNLQDFFGNYIGSSSAINEMNKLSSGYFSFYSFDFKNISSPEESRTEKNLSEALKTRIQQLRQEIIQEEKITREMVMTYSSLSNSRENNKTQRTMKLLVGLTLFVSFLPIQSIFEAAINFTSVFFELILD